MSRLKKKEIETLLQHYDRDPKRALLTCLQIVFQNSELTWNEAIQNLDERWNRDALSRGDTTACDDLAKYLVEFRALDQI